MKLSTSLFFLLLFLNSLQSQNLDSIINTLEYKMSNYKIYDLKKESSIDSLIKEELKTSVIEDKYKINNAIFEHYQFYSFDKALEYIEKNIEIGKLLNNDELLDKAILKMGLLLVNTGRFKESIDALSEIKRNALPKSLLNSYFIAHKEGYSGLSYNTAVNSNKLIYLELYKAYQDSLYDRLKPDSEEALRLKEKEYRDKRNLDKAFKVNSQRLSKVKLGSRLYSLITFERSLLYELNNQLTKQKEYLIHSAISDIQASVKDNASMGTLAKILFSEGDIDRAHKYINFSYNDAEFYNSRLRFVDIANNMPLITKAYEQKTAKQKQKLEYSLVFISVLAVFLLIAIYTVYKQVKKVSEAKDKLKIANNQLLEFNKKLNTSNEELKNLYLELSEVDKIKEHYIGNFVNLYSEYITKLDVYRKLVSKYVNANQMNALLKLSKSKRLIDEELEIFNNNFDSSFLHIYPNFLSEVNKLLKPDHQIEITDIKQLNTELRILALIKLGIDNSSRIAKILRYSVNTIYNYRAAINKSAIDKTNFEKMIKSI